MKEKKFLLIFTLIVGMLLGTGCGAGLSEEDAKQTIEGLESFTEMEQIDDWYDFEYTDWTIRYSDGNSFVKFDYSCVEQFLGDSFGYDCMYDSGYVGYDFSENRISMYIDGEVDEGHITIISYSIDDDKYTVNIDAEVYTASDELIDRMKEYEVVESILEEVDSFKKTLKENNLSYEKVSSMTYDNIKDYFE